MSEKTAIDPTGRNTSVSGDNVSMPILCKMSRPSTLAAPSFTAEVWRAGLRSRFSFCEKSEYAHTFISLSKNGINVVSITNLHPETNCLTTDCALISFRRIGIRCRLSANFLYYIKLFGGLL